MVESEACSSFQDEPAGVGRWYFSRKEIEENSPSRRDGIDLKEENYLRKSYVVFLQELGIRLKLWFNTYTRLIRQGFVELIMRVVRNDFECRPQIAIATAILFCHRFFLRQSHAKNDRWIIARACMFLAGKVECAPRSLKDLIQVSYAIIHRKDPAAAEKIKQEELIDQEAKLILFGERVVLATLDFDLNVHHPYRPLIEALLKFDIHRKEIGLVAWNYITTGLQTSLCLQYEPHVIAAAAIYRAAKFLNVDNITSDGEVWWCEFNITSQLLEEVVNQMMAHYENNPMPLSSDSGALSSHGFTTEPEESDAESGYYQASSAPNVWGSSVSSSQPVFSHSSADNLGGPQIQRNQQAALMEFLENADHRRIYNEIMEDMERITEDFNKASFNLELEDWMHGISLSDTFKPEYTDHDENDGGNVESSVGEVLSIMQADSENSVKEEEVISSSVNDTKEKQSQQEEGTSSSG